MIRDCELEDISDGKLYRENDMVRVDTGGCLGCKISCCENMGKTIILDPYDVYQLSKETKMSFEELLSKYLELNITDGLILPNIKMQEDTKKCAFLNEDNRCEVHKVRPEVCRLFPLGRYWESDTSFYYILQTGQCSKENLSKLKVKKWLDRENLADYNNYVVMWHKFVKKVTRAQAQLAETDVSDEHRRVLTMYILRTFFVTPYEEQDFYKQFEQRIAKAGKDLALDED